MVDFNDFATKLDEELHEHSFKQHSIENIFDVEEVVVWRRRTWNSNRAVLLIRLSDKNIESIKNLGAFSQQIKFKAGKQIGYKIFLYALGLQIIYYGDDFGDLTHTIKGHVDKYDNQRVVLQSIFLLDRACKTMESTRTWGQFLTGQYQDIIENTIGKFIAL